MNKQFTILPCTEQFELDQNNICSKCQTKILSSEEINLTSGDGGRVCVKGSLKNMNTHYVMDPFRVFAFSVILVFGSSLFTMEARAQSTAPVEISKEQTQGVKVSGTLHDENGIELPFANIAFYQKEILIDGVQTDIDGYFELTIAPQYLDKKVTVKIKYVGFDNLVIELSKKQLQSGHIDLGEIILKEQEMELFIIGKVEIQKHPSNKELD
jgi:hypothetical protein